MTFFNRRGAERSSCKVASALTAAALLTSLVACASSTGSNDQTDGPIKVGSIYDLSGPIGVIGQAKADATALAIKDINDKGGVLGRQLELISYDSQSDNAKYTQYANKLVLQDKVSVVDAGVTSASREAIRPITDRSKTPFFYGNLYEGGACAKGLFATGSVPSQQLAQLVPYAAKNFGKKFTILAADYNFGHDEALWAEKYIKENGGEVVRKEYLPLDQNDFGSSLNNLQADKPDVVVSLLVGGDQMSFYKQFAAAGLSESMKIITPVFGDGQEQIAVGGAATKGVVIAYSYLQEIESPANDSFVKLWHSEYGENYPYITPSAVAAWNDWHLWALAVEKAGSLDYDKVISSLESGISYDSPGGQVTLDPGSHHAIQNVYLAEGTETGAFKILETHENVSPKFEQSTCDLVANPTTNKQFKPTVD